MPGRPYSVDTCPSICAAGGPQLISDSCPKLDADTTAPPRIDAGAPLPKATARSGWSPVAAVVVRKRPSHPSGVPFWSGVPDSTKDCASKWECDGLDDAAAGTIATFPAS